MARVTRMTKRRLGELLRAEGLVSEEQVKQALVEQRKSNLFLGEALVKLGFVTEDSIAATIAQQFGLPFICVDQYTIAKEMLDLFPVSILREYQFLPLDKIGKILIIVGAGLMNHDVLDELERLSGCRVCQYIGTWKDIFGHIETLYKDRKTQDTELSGLGSMLLQTAVVGKKDREAKAGEKKSEAPAAAARPGSMEEAVEAITGGSSDVLREALAAVSAPAKPSVPAKAVAAPAAPAAAGRNAAAPAKTSNAKLAATPGSSASSASNRTVPSARLSAFSAPRPGPAAPPTTPAPPAAEKEEKAAPPAAPEKREPAQKKAGEGGTDAGMPKGGLLGLLKK